MNDIVPDDARDAMVEAGASCIIGWGAHSDAFQCIRSALFAAERAGYVLAPIKPTDEMIEAGYDVLPFAPGTETHRMAGGITPEKMWRAMLAPLKQSEE